MNKQVLSGCLAVTLSAAAVTAGAGPANAADGSNTTVTFTLAGEGLSISAPTSASLGTASNEATTVTGSLGTVTVTDQRGQLAAAWTATVSSTPFTTGGGSPAETIPAANVTHTPGPRQGATR